MYTAAPTATAPQIGAAVLIAPLPEVVDVPATAAEADEAMLEASDAALLVTDSKPDEAVEIAPPAAEVAVLNAPPPRDVAVKFIDQYLAYIHLGKICDVVLPVEIAPPATEVAVEMAPPATEVAVEMAPPAYEVAVPNAPVTYDSAVLIPPPMTEVNESNTFWPDTAEAKMTMVETAENRMLIYYY